MDIKELKQTNSYYFEREKQISSLKSSLKEDLVFAYQDGLFSANFNLINFLNSLDDSKELYILDDLEQPMLINDLNEFKTKAFETNQNAIKRYYENFLELNKIRRKLNI